MATLSCLKWTTDAIIMHSGECGSTADVQPTETPSSVCHPPCQHVLVCDADEQPEWPLSVTLFCFKPFYLFINFSLILGNISNI